MVFVLSFSNISTAEQIRQAVSADAVSRVYFNTVLAVSY